MAEAALPDDPRRQAAASVWLRPLAWGEIVLGVGAVALVAWVLVAIATFRELLESNTVAVTVRNLGNGLRLAVAEAMMQQRMAELTQLPGANPVALLAGPPAGYLGEQRGDFEAPPGSWYFDLDRRALVYVPRLRRHLRLAQGEAEPLRWRLVAAKARRPDADDNRTEGLALVPVSPYEWF